MVEDITQKQIAAAQQNVEMQQLAMQSDKSLVFSFLQSLDVYLIQILTTSTFSALYELDPASGQMQKLDVEGSLYLLERSVPPLFQMLILNRKSREDFADQITSATTFADRDNYVAYTGTCGTRRTIFFSIQEEKEHFLTEVNNAIEQLRRDEGLVDDDDDET